MSRRPFVRYQYEINPHALQNYTEDGVSTGAKLNIDKVTVPDLVRIITETRNMTLMDIDCWLKTHKDSLEDSTFVVTTDDGHSLEPFKRFDPDLIINRKPLNKIRHLNTFLNCANEVLAPGGYLLCFARTASLKKQKILESYPPVINKIVFAGHYFWHRFCPKMPGLKKIYFGITKGQDRTYNRVEILGRMYRAGFDVVHEEFNLGKFFVIGKKSLAPIWDDEPKCGPLIKLRRVGKDGKMIGVYKFRTMYSYSEYLQPYVYKHEGLQTGGKFKKDYRVNGWGRIMRACWLDELPMILNVLKGQMKIVGVRPLSQHYFSLYTKEMQDLRIKVKPGLIPPFYCEKETPKTLENVMDSERRYIEQYLEHPLKTDWNYFWGGMKNILIKRKRSN